VKPDVSIVMAAKNYARFLPEAVDSVFAQTFTDWELLIIDDASTDATPGTVAPYLGDSRVRYVRSDGLGQSRAKNLGIALSRGRFIAFLDADDAWLPMKLEKQLALFAAQPAAGVVFSRRCLMNEAGLGIPVRAAGALASGFVLAEMFTQNFVCFSSAVVRREIFYQFAYVDEELVRYRTGHGNLSKKLRDRVETALSIMHRAEARYGVGATVPAATIADGYASTCRTLGYVLRGSEPGSAAAWYMRALAWPARRWISLKGLAVSIAAAMRKPRSLGAAENASANL
jgi:glycosyltransferase involved in cell wall biosynthesis